MGPYGLQEKGSHAKDATHHDIHLILPAESLHHITGLEMPKLNLSDLHLSPPEARLMIQMELKGLVVSQRTADLYSRRIAHLGMLASRWSFPYISKDFFVALTSEVFASQGGGTSTLHGYLAAIRFMHHKHNIFPSWTDDEDLKLMLRGFRYNGKVSTREEKGSINQDMIHQFSAWACNNGLNSFLRPVNLMFHGRLRLCELLNLRAGDLSIALESNRMHTLTIRRDKRVNAKHPRQETHERFVEDSFVMYFDAAARGIQHGQPLFPDLNGHVLNETIARAAQALNWPQGLKWSSHSLRHGGFGHIKTITTNALQNAISASSTPNRQHYCRSNEVRSQSRAQQRRATQNKKARKAGNQRSHQIAKSNF